MLKTIKDSGIQRSMFDGNIPLKLKKPIRLIELFAGIGAQAKAIENLGIEFEHYRICEFDKYAVASYNAVHGTNFSTSDITKIHAEDLGIIDMDKYDYIMTYSFPCTDLSKAGKQLGMSRESGTRSGLLWEVERLLKETKELPQILLMENVPDILSEKNRNDFYSWCDFLEKLGYTSKYAILNAKDYGIPQNRERCFMISWLGNNYYYDFPKIMPLTKRLKDLLEKKVDKKYYLNNKAVTYITKRLGKYTQLCDNNTEYCKSAITAKGNQNWTGNFIKCEHIAQLSGNYESSNRVYSDNGLSSTINTMQGGNLEPKILENAYRFYEQAFETVEKNECENGDTIDAFNKKVNKSGYSPTVTTRPDGFKTAILVYDGYNQSIRKDNSTVGTLTRNCGADLKRNGIGIINNAKIRKLTPKECWRLMGFDDESFSRAEKVVSNSQLYKQAGNSIVVNVLMEIFRKLF